LIVRQVGMGYTRYSVFFWIWQIVQENLEDIACSLDIVQPLRCVIYSRSLHRSFSTLEAQMVLENNIRLDKVVLHQQKICRVIVFPRQFCKRDFLGWWVKTWLFPRWKSWLQPDKKVTNWTTWLMFYFLPGSFVGLRLKKVSPGHRICCRRNPGFLGHTWILGCPWKWS